MTTTMNENLLVYLTICGILYSIQACQEFHLGQENMETSDIPISKHDGSFQISLWTEKLPQDTTIAFEFIDSSNKEIYELRITVNRQQKIVVRNRNEILVIINSAQAIIEQHSWTMFHCTFHKGHFQMLSYNYKDSSKEKQISKPSLLVLDYNKEDDKIAMQNTTQKDAFILRFPLSAKEEQWELPSYMKLNLLNNNALFTYTTNCESKRSIWENISAAIGLRTMVTTELIAWILAGIFFLNSILFMAIAICSLQSRKKNKHEELPPIPPKITNNSVLTPLMAKPKQSIYINQGFQR